MNWFKLWERTTEERHSEYVTCYECGVLVLPFYAKNVSVRSHAYWSNCVRSYCQAHAPAYDETVEPDEPGQLKTFYARFEVDGKTGVPLGYIQIPRSRD